ncbi:folylpolyglutamate synthase/dihydrofolate synthase family protein [Aeromicrobium sp.]|uniref:bifunctional folylpolyglutamate synthase/dihydrofolate synthase n=1 Tax=Aeromicrobium sp. TaxID=1871063 RepID=UPI0028AE7D7F|nr:folylpolyglutamate synthase/dihydrofolate synthase family protein [Aeromicrobium sp.]
MRPTYPDVELALLSRWPETRLEPSLDRIRAICELMGDPQRSQPVIQLTGTNGKTSTSRMIDALLRALDLRTGRFTSPHLQRINERICVDGEPLTDELFVDAYADVAVYADLVDQTQPHPLSFFEMLVAMGYAAFADAPVDVAVVEVGMGGAWDATSVADANVAVVTPIDIDHASYLGDTPADIAVEKSGIIKPGTRTVLASQPEEVLEVMLGRANEVGSLLVLEGADFRVESRTAAVGGQMFTIQGVKGRYEDILLPLHGEFQARNAALALAAVEVFTGEAELDPELIRAGFGAVTSPGRLEVVRRSPTIVLDAAHNPHGVRAMVESIGEEFTFNPLIGVVGIMADKDAEEILRELEPTVAHVICTQNSTERSLAADALGEIATGLFGPERVTVVPRLDDALERAISFADASGEEFRDAIGSGGVIVTGSVVTVGEARTLLRGAEVDPA